MITDRDVILSVSEGSPQLAAVCTLFMRFFALRVQNDRNGGRISSARGTILKFALCGAPSLRELSTKLTEGVR